MQQCKMHILANDASDNHQPQIRNKDNWNQTARFANQKDMNPSSKPKKETKTKFDLVDRKPVVARDVQ